jgi:hypothetical protein
MNHDFAYDFRKISYDRQDLMSDFLTWASTSIDMNRSADFFHNLIKNRWVSCPDIVNLIHLDTTFFKGDFVKKANRLEFKQVQKTAYYFDGHNEPRKTSAACYLSFRLLKQTPQARSVI